ncbi:MAG TPA: ATP-binding cassette domain-containing protein [Fimbriimonadaceae bacterium]|nr:ATP-binding cassette domain-containing protein [Fimbriimonadaceae bacterium]HRE92924.1 ATP-binding cassette domain-containing protein [Fimbriimonadaceae bacterium]HRI74535.1 ATP-binding cassette domain-containing protein [Fimbriimonadaceae bacterium]
MYAIETENLRKEFVSPVRQPGLKGAIKGLVSRETKRSVAVESFSIQVQEGEFVGFLGPNGAGKTTTIKMLTGILYPTSGTARVLGEVPFERKSELLRQIALVMGNRQQLWWDLPARESFAVLKEVYDVPAATFNKRVDRLIADLDLSDKVDTQVRKLSLGERMKCELVAALLHGPRVVFLDEPTIGLDVISQQRIRQFLKEFNEEEGCTVVLTSHYMQDVEELCERVVVINHGNQVFDGTLADLRSQYSPERRLRVTFTESPETNQLPAQAKVLEQNSAQWVLSLPADAVAPITSEILQNFAVADLSLEEADVEDALRALFAEGPGAVSRETPAR